MPFFADKTDEAISTRMGRVHGWPAAFLRLAQCGKVLGGTEVLAGMANLAVERGGKAKLTQVPVSSVEQRPQPFPVPSFRETLSDVRLSIADKRRQGVKLDSVDTHLERIFRRSLDGCSPSAAHVLARTLSTLGKPAIVMLIFTLIILSAVQKSAAWFAAEDFEVTVPGPPITLIDEVEPEIDPLPIETSSPATGDAVSTVSVQAEAVPAAGVFASIAWPIGEQEEVKVKAEAVQQPVLTKEGKQPPVLRTQPQRHSLIEFICGIISAYRSNVSDCSGIARIIVDVSQERSMDPFYIASIIAHESRFSSTARSNQGALGLMQLLPDTAREVAETSFGSRSSPRLFDPRTNIALGVDYMQQLERRYEGNRMLALAAYNWGPSNVQDVGGRHHRMPRQVRHYVSRVLEHALRWRKNYQNALREATALATQLASDAQKAG